MNRFSSCGYRFYYKSIPKSNIRPMDIKTFVFLDIETTGLPKMENNRTKITELCMVAIEASHIQMGVFPRVQNKLNLCFNPWKLISAESEKITGLSNPILEYQSKFSSDTVNTINSFLNHNQKPLCFVAHNGDNFDYPILQREVEKSGSTLIDDIVCIDSLHLFRQLHYEEKDVTEVDVTEIPTCLSLCIEATDGADGGEGTLPKKIFEAKKLNETTPKKQMVEIFPSIPNPAKRIKLASPQPNTNFMYFQHSLTLYSAKFETNSFIDFIWIRTSTLIPYNIDNITLSVSFKLSDIYARMIKRSPVKEHQAEGDVSMLITCAATLGEKFVNWANAHAKNFCDVPSMVPGKKIGT